MLLRGHVASRGHYFQKKFTSTSYTYYEPSALVAHAIDAARMRVRR